MARTVLLIDCCVHGEQSRTLKLAQRYLDTLEDVQVNHQKLYELDLAPLSYEETVERKRTDIAKTFAQADEIVVAAPYWDLSFPSILKVYLEHVCVTGITFHYVGYETQGLSNGQESSLHQHRRRLLWARITWVRSTSRPCFGPCSASRSFTPSAVKG